MGLVERIVEQRDKQVLDHARPHLDQDEELVCWTRVRWVGEKKRGYVFLTKDKLVLHWTEHSDGHHTLRWQEIASWGVDDHAAGGPLLAVETADSEVVVQMPVASRGVAHRVTELLERFAHLAPTPRRPLRSAERPEDFKSDAGVAVAPAKKTVAGHTKRVVVTAVGVLLVAVGIVIIPVPGPWSFPLVIGGLALLAIEYEWAEDILEWAKARSRKAAAKVRSRKAAALLKKRRSNDAG